MSVRRVLFCGLGSVGQRHLRNVRRRLGDGVAIGAYRVRGETAILDGGEDRSRDVVAEHRITVFRDLDAALSWRPDVVFVTNPTRHHLTVAVAAAEAGAHLFIEKPVAHELAGLEVLEARVAAAGLVAFVGQQHRFHPAFDRLRRALAAGHLGRLWSVRAEVGEALPDFHPWEDYRRSYAARADLGGGVVNTQNHELDLLVALLGVPSRVVAIGGPAGDLAVDVEAQSLALLDFQVAGRPVPASLHQDYLQRPPRRSLRLLATAGQVEWDLARARYLRRDVAGEVVEDIDDGATDRNAPFLAELDHFLACVDGQARPLVDLAAARKTLAVALAITRSIRTGAPVVPTLHAEPPQETP